MSIMQNDARNEKYKPSQPMIAPLAHPANALLKAEIHVSIAQPLERTLTYFIRTVILASNLP